MSRKSIIVAGVGIAVGVSLILSFVTGTGIFEKKTYIIFDEVPITLEEKARISEVIVIGKITRTEYYDDGKIRKPTNSMYIDIEELTGNYKDSRIMVDMYGDGNTIINKSVQLKEGERILLFLSDGDWGVEDSYTICCTSQKFSIDDNDIAYNPLFGSYRLDELIGIIEEARANRIKDAAINTDYVVIGKVKSIEKVSITEEEADKYTLTANVTIEIDRAVSDYKEKETTFFVWGINDIKDCIGEDKSCIYFIKYGTQELLTHIPPERLDKLAEYYLTGYGVYRIVDGKAYGREYPEGIELNELVERIKMFKGIG